MARNEKNNFRGGNSYGKKNPQNHSRRARSNQVSNLNCSNNIKSKNFTEAIHRNNQEIIRKIIEQWKISGKLKERPEMGANLIDIIPAFILIVNPQGKILAANKFSLERLGFNQTELIGWDCIETIFYEEDKAYARKVLQSCIEGDSPIQTGINRLITSKGNIIYLKWRLNVIRDNKTILGIVATGQDITKEYNSELLFKLSYQFLESAGKRNDKVFLLNELIDQLRNYTGCQAVGIRLLDENDNIPYEAYKGFTEKFYQLESPLSIKSDKCMCINVITGNYDDNLPFYTPAGSFFTNSSTDLLASANDSEKGKTRNVCNEFGYESIALIPIKTNGKIRGAIHIADKRKNMLPLEKVEILEKLAIQVSITIDRIENIQELENSRQRQSLAATGTQMIIWDENLMTGKITMEQYTKESLKCCDENNGTTWQKYIENVHPEDRKELSSSKMDYCSGRTDYFESEHRAMTTKGKYVWILCRGKIVEYNGKGTPLRVTGTLLDITEKKQAQQEKAELAEKYHLLANFTYDWEMWLGPDKTYYYVSPSCERITGYRPEEFHNNSKFIESIVHPEDKQKIIDHYNEYMAKGNEQVCHLEFRVITKWGKVKWISHYCQSVYSERGIWMGRRGSNRDITDKVAARKQQERMNTRLNNKNAELESIIRVATHDLRTPLVNITGFAKELNKACKEIRPLLEKIKNNEEIKSKINEILKDDVDESLFFILAGTKKVDALLSGLLKLARLGKAATNFEKLDIKSLVKEVQSQMKYELTKNDCTLKLGKLHDCTGDRDQLNQVFSNLISNAIKYKKSGQPGKIKIYSKKQNGNICYYVQDNGIGIREDNLQTIFELFYRESPENKHIAGDGLGLSIVKRIIQRHNGSITVQSKLNQGSTFIIELPQ
jgi:PAS domain S-box-containing protein